jgi:hypothetical protein
MKCIMHVYEIELIGKARDPSKVLIGVAKACRANTNSSQGYKYRELLPVMLYSFPAIHP